MRRSLTLDRRVQSEDQFLARSKAGKEPLYVEIVRADTIERRQGSAQHVITSAKSPGSFECPEIREIFDDADRRQVPLPIAADRARFDRIEVAADRARSDRFTCFGQRRRQRLEHALAPLYPMQHGTPCRLWAEARQTGEERDQGVEFG